MMKDISLVITSIYPNKNILHRNIQKWDNDNIFIVMDKKSELNGDVENHYFLKVDREKKFKYEQVCPVNSYSRKNIGYLEAARRTQYIFETDDDNVITDIKLLNAQMFDETELKFYPHQHNLFSTIYSDVKDRIWARGFPLAWLEKQKSTIYPKIKRGKPGLIQYMVNGNPDVDAIFRLVVGEHVNFDAQKLKHGLAVDGLHPFNSQATLWRASDVHLMYLPSTCSFRMTDIYRGYIANAIIRQRGEHVIFTQPAVTQVRNEHSIVGDFFSEHRGYTEVETIVRILEDEFPIVHDERDVLLEIYRKLCNKGIFDLDELRQLDAYLECIG